MIDNPHALEAAGEESTPVACGPCPRGLRGRDTKLRRLASRAAVLAAAAALALIPVPAEASASSADTPLSTEANPEPDVNRGGASARLQIAESEFELLPRQQMFRNGEIRFDEWAPTHRYFGRVGTTSSEATVPDVVYTVEGQPEKSSYQFCFLKRADCQDVEVGVEETSGRLYLHIDLMHKAPGSRRGGVVAYVPDFPEQPVELAAAESQSALKIFREVLVKPSSRVPDCSDYEPATPQLFECLTLGELLPDDPPETTAVMRNALPELVQDRSNYRLIFAEEFEGGESQSPTGDCMTGMATIMDTFNVSLDPCTNLDGSNVPIPCEEVENGYYYSAKTTICGAFIGTDGKFAFKYGYVEMKYEVPAYQFTSDYTNNGTVGALFNDLAFNHHRYGITIDSIEEFLNYEESEIDIAEYIPSSSSMFEISHQYYNIFLRFNGHDSVRTDKIIVFCNERQENHHEPILLRLPVCGQRDQTIVVTKGLEWTPQGLVTYYKVEGDSNPGGTPVPLRKSQIGLKTGKLRGWEHGAVCGDEVDQWLVPVDPDTTDTDPVVFEQVGLSHVPISIGNSTWGYPKSSRVLGQIKIHYIRVFQPENLYTDMEPVYPPLPIAAPDPGEGNRRTCS